MTRRLNELSRWEIQNALRTMAKTLDCPLSINGFYNVYDVVLKEWENCGGYRK